MKRLLLSLLLLTLFIPIEGGSQIPREALTPRPTLQVFTVEEGQQALIQVDPRADITYALDLGAGDIVDIEVTLVFGGTRHVMISGATADQLDTLEGPIIQIGINITTNNSSSIKFEVLAVFRGG